MAKRYNVSGVSGNANTLVSGSVIAGNSVFMGGNFQKVDELAALVSVTAATSTITFTGKWQGSNDNSTWVDSVGANNAANVALATGTATIVTKALDLPYGAYSWRYVRFVLVTGVATGGTTDLYSIAYNYKQLTGADGN